MADEPTTGVEPTTEPAPDPVEPADATGTNGGNTDGAITFADKQALQEYINETLKDRLAREDRKREEAEARARKETEEKALAENQQFRELAEKRQERVVELEGQVGQIEQLTTERDELSQALEAILAKEREGLPEAVIELLNDKSPAKQLQWIAANKATLTKANGRGIEPTPTAQQDPSIPDEERRRHSWKVSL